MIEESKSPTSPVGRKSSGYITPSSNTVLYDTKKEVIKSQLNIDILLDEIDRLRVENKLMHEFLFSMDLISSYTKSKE